ncbi:hypothetical protein RJE46_24820 (plasmid) [Cedecea neteri]|uniref:hypothetical protein n=1 Tax=Cedecea neteri TaxID=158822 RepID=UPI0028934703|nr:hypothetical protein [Cedecea neteri]WNJ82297.1 hypothetical protein RJE46_24820 [Cedecea neteri]
MNDFNVLRICIENKDKNSAMLVFRNKSEPAARKILEKINVRDIPGTGKIFWQNVQHWLFNACRHENNQEQVCPQMAQGNSIASVRVNIPNISPSTDVCAWPEGFPPVHVYMSDICPELSRT